MLPSGFDVTHHRRSSWPQVLGIQTQQLREAQYGVQWRAQLMAHARQELGLGLVGRFGHQLGGLGFTQALSLAHIAEVQRHAPVRRVQIHFQPAVLGQEGHHQGLGASFAQGLGAGIGQRAGVLTGKQGAHALAHQRGPPLPQQPGGLGVEVDDAAMPVQRQKAVAHVLQGVAQSLDQFGRFRLSAGQSLPQVFKARLQGLQFGAGLLADGGPGVLMAGQALHAAQQAFHGQDELPVGQAPGHTTGHGKEQCMRQEQDPDGRCPSCPDLLGGDADHHRPAKAFQALESGQCGGAFEIGCLQGAVCEAQYRLTQGRHRGLSNKALCLSGAGYYTTLAIQHAARPGGRQAGALQDARDAFGLDAHVQAVGHLSVQPHGDSQPDDGATRDGPDEEIGQDGLVGGGDLAQFGRPRHLGQGAAPGHQGVDPLLEVCIHQHVVGDVLMGQGLLGPLLKGSKIAGLEAGFCG